MKKLLLIGLLGFSAVLNAIEGDLYRYMTPQTYQVILEHLRAGDATVAKEHYWDVSEYVVDELLLNALQAEKGIDQQVLAKFRSLLGE